LHQLIYYNLVVSEGNYAYPTLLFVDTFWHNLCVLGE